MRAHETSYFNDLRIPTVAPTRKENLEVNPSRTISRRSALIWILIATAISVAWGYSIEASDAEGLVDFRAIYFGARAALDHQNPYHPSEFLQVYTAEGGTFPSDRVQKGLFLRSVPICVNLPTTLFLVAPFALLPWGASHALWLILTGAGFTLAAFLAWDLAREHAPRVSLFLICIMLANSEVLFTLGNTAGIAVSLAVVAVWCFFRERLIWAGILCLAISLALKPHDSGLVWLYLLVMGRAIRKRALYTAMVTVLLAVPAVIWISNVAPNWDRDLGANLAATSAHGDISDPGPDSISRAGSADIIVDLQTVVSVFRDEPVFYNPAVWGICGGLMALLIVKAMRSQPSPGNAWYALAAVAPLTMVITYHRPYDAKLLLLAIPACALLWAEGRRTGRIALLVTGLAITFTSDIPLGIMSFVSGRFNLSEMNAGARLLSIFVVRPTPLILLAMAMFYLWMCFARPGRKVAARKLAHCDEIEIAHA